MTSHDRVRTRTGIALAVGLVVIAAMAPPVAAQADAGPAFLVEVNADGSAEVTVRSTFDLTTDAERAAFRTLMTDEQAQEDARARFLGRMRTVADEAENATGREMQVTGATIDLRRTADNATGVVSLSVAWAGLAAVRDDGLVVTEPFASGFTPDRTFVLRPPDGYVLRAATPAPSDRTESGATWAPGSDLGGFRVEMSPGGTDAPVQTDGQPGFGAIAALLAVLVGTAALSKERYIS